MNDTTSKQFIQGLWIEEKQFDNGNSILKLSVLPEKFIDSVKSAEKNDKGYIKLVISKRKEVGKNGDTHYCYVDTWKPSTKLAQAAPLAPKKQSVVKQPQQTQPANDDLAF